MGRKLDNAISLYMEGIRDGNARVAVETYTGDRYTQHSTGVADGVEGFVAFFEPFIERNPERDIRVIRAIEDGRHVFVHAYQNINDGEAEWVTTDFFDTDADDRIVEHWDVIAEYVAITRSGQSSVGGHTEVADLDRTAANKAIVRAMIERSIANGRDGGADGDVIADDCVHHRSDRVIAYDELVLLVGQGNFVATLCKASGHTGPLAHVDLFRLDQGSIVEHWDNTEPVPANDVNSGKF